MGWLVKSLGLVVLMVCAVSCGNGEARYEVTPIGEGRVSVKKVPYTPEELAEQREQKKRELEKYYGTLVPAGTTAPAPMTSDPQLATIESLWPKLGVADRAALVDMATTRATTQP